MTNLVQETEELKNSTRDIREQGLQEFYEELLEEYRDNVSKLKAVGNNYPWEQLVEVQEKHSEIEKKLPNVSDEEFEEYIWLGDLLAVLLKD